jgi:hypothetical protein
MGQLKDSEFEELTGALVEAFPAPNTFAMMVRFKLGRTLATITAPVNAYDFQVFEVVQFANAQDRIQDLVTGALNMNERNKRLLEFARSLGVDEGIAEFESIVLKRVPLADNEIWRTRMAASERPVCRVEVPEGAGIPLKKRGVGTGFLVGEQVVITNRHVVNEFRKAGYKDSQIVVRFDYKVYEDASVSQEGVAYNLIPEKSVLDEDENLDYALLQVDGQPAKGTVAGQPLAPARGWLKPVHYEFRKDDPLFIIQHPEGRHMKFSPGAVTDPAPAQNRVAYTDNTLKGSSGSPCFTADWNVVALHHWGGTDHNRGVTFSAILNAVVPKKIPGVFSN